MIQDIRYAARILLKNKLFTTIAVFSLALGIGANTAIFSLIDAVMLRMLPVKEPQELVLFQISSSRGQNYSFNYPLYERFRDRNQSLEGVIAATGVGRARLAVNEPGAEVESAQLNRVSGNFFSVLGVGAVIGRPLTETDDKIGSAQPVAVISYDFWKRRFGLDPGIVGKKITLNDRPLTIVGVAPPGFFGYEIGSKPDIWNPITETGDPILRQAPAWRFRVLGRLRNGANVWQARVEMDLIFRKQLDEAAGARAANWTPTQKRMHFERQIELESGSAGYTRLRQQFRQPLLILMTIVALVLLIACANIANLLLARATTRRKEIALRLALGASRLRLLRQLLTESVMLAVIGGGLGLLFAHWCARILLSYLPQQNQVALDLTPDLRVLGFTLSVSIFTGLLFGLTPALRATRLDLTASLKDITGTSAGRSRLALNKLLVVTQVALSLFLLVGAGLFVRSLQNLKNLETGFDRENLVQFNIDSGSGYNLAQEVSLRKELLVRLERLPGVRSASFSSFSLLIGNNMTYGVTVPGYTPGPDENLSCSVLVVGPRFFETMKISILEGRDFGPQDERPVETSTSSASSATAPAPPPPPSLSIAINQAAQSTTSNAPPPPPRSVLINQTMARYFYGSESPVGKRFRSGGSELEIIGVVKDAKYSEMRQPPPRTYYLYYLQRPRHREGMTYQLRTGSDQLAYGGMINRLAREIDPQLQVINLRTMEDVVNDALVQERFTAQLGSAFSLFALLLACIGLYGLMSYAVARRTNEIGIRMALGAQARDVVLLVMRETMLMVMVGVALGLGAALAATRLVSNLLYGLTPGDPLTIALAASLMIAVAALAGYLPARRASRIDPMIALHYE